MTEYTITELTATTPATPERRTPTEDLIVSIREWQQRHGFPVAGATLGTDDDDDLTVTLTGLTLEDGSIVPNEKEFEYTATILVEVTVRGSVTARDEDTATEEAEYQLETAELDIDASGLWVTSWDIQSVSVDEVEEE